MKMSILPKLNAVSTLQNIFMCSGMCNNCIIQVCKRSIHTTKIRLSSNTTLNSSDTHSQNDSESADSATRILDQSLLHVPEFGWTEKALIAGAKTCGYSSSASGLFPRGGADLALHFYQMSNKRLFNKLQEELVTQAENDQPNKSISEFVKNAIDDRIRMTAVYQSTWPQAMGLMTRPNAASDALRNLGQLVDDIWFLAGDKSHDMNWYTKRAELAFIYKTAELFMLQDKSEDFTETSKFISRRFEDVGAIASTLSLSSDFTKGLFNGGLQSMWTVMKNMTGVYPR